MKHTWYKVILSGLPLAIHPKSQVNMSSIFVLSQYVCKYMLEIAAYSQAFSFENNRRTKNGTRRNT